MYTEYRGEDYDLVSICIKKTEDSQQGPRGGG